MSKGFRLRAVFSVLAVGTASLALAAAASASSDDGVVIQTRDACDPASFPPGLCHRTDNSGGVVTFLELQAVVGKKHSHPAWRFTKDDVRVKRGTPLMVEFGRGGEAHSFTDVTATGPDPTPGCIGLLNGLIFGSEATAPMCGTDDPGGAGLGAILATSGVFPGGPPLVIDTSTPGTRFFQCMIHPWMRTTVTVQ